MGASLDAETSVWLRDIGDNLHAKLAKTGIIDARLSRTLATFLEAYKAERIDAKPNTVKAWNTSIKRLVGFFGDVSLKNVTHEKAALYRVYLVQSGLREASVSKMIGVARLFFGVALSCTV